MEEIVKLNLERQLIAHFARTLDRACEDRDLPLSIDRETARLALLFVRDFLIPHHHLEETLAFRRLEERGLPGTFGPLAALRKEHAEMRRRSTKLTKLVKRAAREQTWDGVQMASRFSRLAAIIRAHSRREARILAMLGPLNAPAADASASDALLEVVQHPWLDIIRELEARIAFLGRDRDPGLAELVEPV